MMNSYVYRMLVVVLLGATLAAVAGERGRDHAEQDAETHRNEITLTAEQRKAAGIRVETLVVRPVAGEIMAPGEVKLNAYLTRKVAPRVTAQVVKRHARLGDHVSKGQALATLSSVDMAEAQGALQVAEREWQRVRKLGRDTVSDRRYTEARIAREQALGRVRAYGMTPGQVSALLADEQGGHADGSFQLIAPQDGTVISDAFIEGEFVAPGHVLFDISDETQVWVEASLMPEEAVDIRAGNAARVQVGDDWFEGRVIQSHHALNEVTRTLAVRIEIPNPEERLHPGLFVETRIQAGEPVDVLAISQEAVLRSPDGDWMIFIEEEPGRFRPVEVTVERNVGTLAVIEGVPEGTRVVTEGVFFVQSELAKSGFEVHAH